MFLLEDNDETIDDVMMREEHAWVCQEMPLWDDFPNFSEPGRNAERYEGR